MIAHVIGRRSSFSGVLAYLAGPGRHGEHVDPQVVAGDREAQVFVGEPMDSAAARLTAEHLDSARRAFQSRVKEPVLHVALSFNENTTAEQRRAVYESYVERMGCFDRSAWVAVEHGRSHVREDRGELKGGHEHGHLVISLVGDDGRAVRLGKHKDRSQDVARHIEREHGLKVLESRELGVSVRGVSRPALERAGRLAREPETHYLERVVRAAAIDAGDEREFVGLVREHGVTVKPRMAKGSATDVVGYSYSVPGSASYGGGRLARDLSLPRLRERWADPVARTADQAAHRAAGRLASWSIETERTPGPLARESRELGRFAQTRSSAGGLVLTVSIAGALAARLQAVDRETESRELEQRSRRGQSRGRDRDRGIEVD